MLHLLQGVDYPFRLTVGLLSDRTVAVEVVVVADGFGNGQVQHVVLRIAPVGFG